MCENDTKRERERFKRGGEIQERDSIARTASYHRNVSELSGSCLYRYIYIYIYIYIFKASPLPPAPLDAGNCWLVDCGTGSLFYIQLSFWRPWGSIFGTLGNTLVIQGSRGTPNGHIGVQVFIFIDFRVPFGGLLGPTLETCLWFFDDFGCLNGRRFQGPCFWWSRDGNDARMQWLYVL